MKHYWTLALVLIAMLILVGCGSNKTETGYEPRRLGMSNGTLRSLYAPAFSPEAQAVENERREQIQTHRPGY